MDNGGVSPGEAGGMFAGIIALLYAIGRGIVWLVDWRGKREKSEAARLKAWEESLDRREKEQRELISKREKTYRDRIEARLVGMEATIGILSAAVFEMEAELQKHAPGSPALAKARMALQHAFPMMQETPADFEELLKKINGKGDGE